MSWFTLFLYTLAGWTLIEGSLVSVAPRQALRVLRRLFPALADYLATAPLRDLRIMGLIELAFGVILLSVLVLGP